MALLGPEPTESQPPEKKGPSRVARTHWLHDNLGASSTVDGATHDSRIGIKTVTHTNVGCEIEEIHEAERDGCKDWPWEEAGPPNNTTPGWSARA